MRKWLVIPALALIVGCGGMSDDEMSVKIHDEFLRCSEPYEYSNDVPDLEAYNACVRVSVAKRRAAGLPR